MMPEIRPAIRKGRPDDADFIARAILSAQRGARPRGWFDIALDQSEPQVLDFLRKLAVAKLLSWYHVSQFWIAEVNGEPVAALCAMPSRETCASMRAAIEEVAHDKGMSYASLTAMFSRGAYARGCWIQGGEEDWLIEHVASALAHAGAD